MFTSTKLRQIVAIDRAGSLSAASHLLSISQSTLTKAVADVEQDLGMVLFHRTSRGVLATPEGREFLDRAERIVADFDMLIDDTIAQRQRTEQVLRIAVAPASQEGLYNRAVAHMLKKNNDICLHMVGLPVERGIRMLKRGDLDLLFAPTAEIVRESDFEVQNTGIVYPYLFCRHEHPLLQEPEIRPAMIGNYRVVAPDFYRGYAQRLLELMGGDESDARRRLLIIGNFSITKKIVADSDAFGVVNKVYGQSRSFQSQFRMLDLGVFEPLPMGVARLSRWLPNRAVRSCLAAVRQFPPESEGSS